MNPRPASDPSPRTYLRKNAATSTASLEDMRNVMSGGKNLRGRVAEGVEVAALGSVP